MSKHKKGIIRMNLDNEINKDNREPKKVLKTKKEINEEIIEATNIILKTERYNYVDVNGIIFLQDIEK